MNYFISDKIFGNHNVRSLFIQTTHLPYISYITQQQVRFYAKSKDKPKAGGKKNVIINENEMSEVMDVELFKSMLEELLSHMKDEFLKQLSIRGTAGKLTKQGVFMCSYNLLTRNMFLLKELWKPLR